MSSVAQATDLLPPPMRIVHKGWFIHRELTLAEAEAFHLRHAASLVGERQQAEHLFQAECNRFWRNKADVDLLLAPRTRKQWEVQNASRAAAVSGGGARA